MRWSGKFKFSFQNLVSIFKNLNIIANKYIWNFKINFYLNSHNYILHIQKWNIPLNEFFQNTETVNFYTIILKSAAGRIEPLSGPHVARGP